MRRLTEEVRKELEEREGKKEDKYEASVTIMEDQGGFRVTITSKPVKKEDEVNTEGGEKESQYSHRETFA